MKRVVSIGLACLILAVSVKDLVYWAGFKLNQRNIANAWCVNWDKPTLNCYGSCYLDGLLKEGKEKDATPATVDQQVSYKQFLLFFQPEPDLSVLCPDQKLQFNPVCRMLLTQNRPRPRHQPPLV